MSGAASAGTAPAHREGASSGPSSRKSSTGSAGSSGSQEESADAAADADVAALLAEVKGAMHAAPTADEQRAEEEEADDKVNIADHIDMNSLTLGQLGGQAAGGWRWHWHTPKARWLTCVRSVDGTTATRARII